MTPPRPSAAASPSGKALVRRALEDAISWQMSLAEAYDAGVDNGTRLRALVLVKQYKDRLRTGRYGAWRE